MSTRKKTQLRLETINGLGEATKDGSGEPWLIICPEGDLRFFGSVSEMKRRVKEFVGGDVKWGSR